MERLKKRTYIFAAVMLAAGLINMATIAKADKRSKNEQWMEQRAPDQFADKSYFHSAENPEQSYKMNDITYKMLNPYGIVARQYTGRDGKTFDIVLIASESRASFHDPRICFSGSGWNITNQQVQTVETKSRGTIPVMFVTMDNDTQRNQIAAFFYKGPSGFMASTRGLKWDMFVQTFLNRPNVEGVFYRFIPQYQGATVDDIKAVISEYLEASKESSQGYF